MTVVVFGISIPKTTTVARGWSYQEKTSLGLPLSHLQIPILTPLAVSSDYF
jgi:hypothetical protein